MKKKLLFILPGLATGGTNSSLDSFYPKLKDRYDISVFAISRQPCNHSYSFTEALLPEDALLSLIYSSYTAQRGWRKLMAFPVKIILLLFRFAGKEYGLIRARRVVKKLAQEKRFDIVVGFEEGPATKIAALFRSPVKIAWIHCDYVKRTPQGMSEESLYASFTKIVCVSQYTASTFSQHYPKMSSRTVAVPNLIDVNRIRQMGTSTIDDSRFVHNGRTLLSVGRFNTVKRFREIPAIASVLKKHGLRFTWYVLGPRDFSSESALFNANIEKYQIGDCVKWLDGKSNPYPYFKASDLYVCLSESEACPMVFKEAQLFGLPIVSTDFPSACEFLNDGNGIVVSLEKLAEAIEEMIKRIESGYRLPPVRDDSSFILEKVHELFD